MWVLLALLLLLLLLFLSYNPNFIYFVDCTEKVECRSVNSTRTTCNTNGLVLDAAVDKEHSTAPCIRNESFGFESSHIWADKGCWATFIVKTD